jgi:pre-mRNA-processing factor 19
MSQIICAISGQPTDSPVVSPKSGAVFDRALITKYLEEYGRDPTNESELRVDELIPLVLNNHISETLRPNTTSIPALLKSLQNEWEVNMIYTYRIRRELQRARQELSHSLYRNDAALRTIARLNQQLNSARAALAGMERADPSLAMEISTTAEEDAVLDKELIDAIDEKTNELTAKRRQRGKEAPEEDAKVDEIKTMALKFDNKNLHDSTPHGITCLDMKGIFTATGGADKKVVLYNVDSDTVESTFVGHRKKISSVLLLPDGDVVISGSHDSHMRTWRKGNENCMTTFKQHHGIVTDLDLHPLGTHFLSVSSDGVWSFSDILKGKSLVKKDMYSFLPAPETDNAYAFGSGKIHPDGSLLGMGTNDGVIYMWDIREQSVAAEFSGHGSQVMSLAFSENGYHLAAGTANGLLKMWDLRKLNSFKTLELTNQEVRSVSFDNFGTYLATAAGTSAKIFHLKSWNELASFEHDDIVTGVNFGSHAQSFVTSSMDRKLRYFTIPSN